jgi:hypothetical protein
MCEWHPEGSNCLFCGMDGSPRVNGQWAALNAVPSWDLKASIAGFFLRLTMLGFTTEDVIDRVGLPRGVIGTNLNNAVGAWASREAKAGRIRQIDTVPSRRRTSHGAKIALWIGVWPQ